MATDTQNSTSSPKSDDLEVEKNPKKTLTLDTQNLTDKSSDLELNNNITLENSDDKEADDTNNKEEADDANNKEEADENNKTSVVPPTSAAAAAAAANNDIEKKFRRAERFGVPVQLSEQEKRNSRAERFGIAGGSEATKASEELKRKARAERFGISVPADEESKKKARLAKFNPETKTPETKTDPQEEEKRKVRALRFAKSSSDAVPHINGKGDVGSDTAIAGNSVGGA